MTEDQMIRQVLQGGGNMPAYGNALSPPETTALVHFLLTLRSGYMPSASDASRKVATTGEQMRTPDTSISTSP
jgi:ubiquinol-cytochrome c reductase cytochrome b subunit